jgi:hypothetical protein
VISVGDDAPVPAGLTPEIEGKLRQFHRVLISYVDFKQAAWISSYLLDNDLYANYPHTKHRLLVQALNCAAIVSYCRPFSGNDAGAEPRIPDLPGRFLRGLTPAERELHDVVMDDRNTALAHSDSRAWNMEPQILRVGGKDTLLPMHHDVHAPLTREAMIVLNGMCIKLREAMFAERLRLEPEVKPYLQIVEYDEKELTRLAAERGVHLPVQGEEA